jgi:hypothetical protein
VTGSLRQFLRRLLASPRALATVAAAGTALIALAFFVHTMSLDGYRRTGTNLWDVPTHAIVPAGQRLCQSNEFVPKGTGAVYPWVGGENGKPGGLMTVTVRAGGRLLAAGRSQPVYPTGFNRFPLDRTIGRDTRNVTVCFTNRSRATAFVYGSVATGGTQAAKAPSYQDGVPAVVRLDYYTGDAESRWSQLGRIADRFALTKAGFLGAWSFWASMAVGLLLIGAAAVRIVREAPR